ncbi:hypothetical protein AMAG_19255 [Allomyces macrogynus ATCC 38327]|uniref:Uncharacterized protein n=1 Tax=Allomyces macrogynus (strain ATCC 38327) TaxID=578462 RepID=A0A0L0SQG2_ALLM3|nr:hypothetical protein AMAG_19255 [Allomyces macrogynus ATCC 38327]|eukprot:KNE64614.1 hypothetical protein AMAG_19255 [Allomyces macrogynus ATCC 38327]
MDRARSSTGSSVPVSNPSSAGVSNASSAAASPNPGASRTPSPPAPELTLAELEAEYRRLLSTTDPLVQATQDARARLCNAYQRQMLADPCAAVADELEAKMWKTAFYRTMDEYRKQLKTVRRNPKPSGTSSTVTTAARRNLLAQLESDFRAFTHEAIGSYHHLVVDLRHAYELPLSLGLGDPAPTNARTDGLDAAQRDAAVLLCFRSLIYLGDLARYREQLLNDGAAPSLAVAHEYYMQAQALIPFNGNPHNQLAILAASKRHDLDAVYHYLRSMLAPHPSTASVVVAKTGTKSTPIQGGKDALAAHAAIVKGAQDGDKVDKDAVETLVTAIGERTAAVVSRDTVLAHTVLLAAFHQLRDDTNEAKNLAFLCTSEARYLAFMRALAKAVVMDASLTENPPLPPLDVAMFWHSHMLSPIRFADDMQRCFGDQMLNVDFPLLRMAKVISGSNKDDLEAGRVFWAAHMPASMPYDLTPALVDETKITAQVKCPTCQAEQSMNMAEYAALRLHAKEHMCASCACEFMAEHVAVDRFLKLALDTPAVFLAGTQLHPLTQLPVPNDRANITDIAALFAKDEWAKRVAKLPFLATWSDVKSIVFAPIVAAKRDALILPGNRFRFGMVLRAHQDVTTGPWSMDLVRAVRRQQRFSSKIAMQLQHGGVHNIYHVHTEALVQYPKFLAMLVIKPRTSLVPTMAIDLAWHTHQLFPVTYAKHTMALAGRVVNHDDSDDAISEALIAEGAKVMIEVWMEVYDEDYFAPNVSYATGGKYNVDTLDYHDATHVFFGVAQCRDHGSCFVAAKNDAAGAHLCFGNNYCFAAAKYDAAGAAQCRDHGPFFAAAKNGAAGTAQCRDHGSCFAAAENDAAGAAQCRDHGPFFAAAKNGAAGAAQCRDHGSCFAAAKNDAAGAAQCRDHGPFFVAAKNGAAGAAQCRDHGSCFAAAKNDAAGAAQCRDHGPFFVAAKNGAAGAAQCRDHGSCFAGAVSDSNGRA